MKKILIADDHSLIRAGLKQLVSAGEGMEVVEAENGFDIFSKLKIHAVDMVILDISLPGRSGLDVLQELKIKYPDIPVLILSVYPEDQYAVRSMKLGADGYLTKDSAPEELLIALKTILGGEKYFSKYLIGQFGEMGNEGKKAILVENLLEELGFLPGITWMVNDFKNRTGIESELNMNYPASFKPVPDDTARAILKVMQEAMANIVRHAKASKVIVSINRSSGDITCEIIDDGIGIPNEKLYSSKSFDLINMRDRIQNLNGKITIKGSKGKGTAININVPL